MPRDGNLPEARDPRDLPQFEAASLPPLRPAWRDLIGWAVVFLVAALAAFLP